MEQCFEQMFDTERFICEIQNRPCLWNIHLEAYSNRLTRQQSWADIAGIIYDDWDLLRPRDQDNRIKDLQKKWKSLRDYYNREKHKISEDGDGKWRKRKAPFLNMLQFLNITKSPSGEATFVNPINTATSAKIITDTTEYRQETTHMTVCQNAPVNPVHNQNETDPNMSFLMTILPDMKTMDEKQNFEFRLEVMNLIKRIKYDDPCEEDSKSWYTNPCVYNLVSLGEDHKISKDDSRKNSREISPQADEEVS